MNDQLLEAIRQRQATAEFGYGITTADRYAKNVADAVGLDMVYKCAATRTVSWDDVLRKAAHTLVYSSPDMVTEEIEYSKRAGSSLKQYDDIELPKNTLMVFRHVLTTPRKDRDGDVLRTEGAKVDPKLLLLWQHVHTLPIGKMLQVAEHNTKRLSLVSCIIDMNELSHDCAVMIDNDMGRFSHGFRAISFNKIKARDGAEVGGFDVKDFEIMEASLVSVPSNTDAEVEEVMLGLVEGGKLTSPVMKEYGKSIRNHRPLQVAAGLDLQKVSLPIDLKITLNGKEIEHEEKANPEGINQYSGGGGGGETVTADVAVQKLNRFVMNARNGDTVRIGRSEVRYDSRRDSVTVDGRGGWRNIGEAARYIADQSSKKEISNEDLSGDGSRTAEGAERTEKDAAGLAKEADDAKAAGKAEEAATDDKVACPECGTMMSRAAGAECPKCGYVMKKGDEEEDDEEMEEEKSTGTKFGRTFSRKNLTTLKEIHGDVEELDRGDHVLSVRGREITKGCRTKIKAMIDEYDIPDGAEEGKSFSVEDAVGLLIAEATPQQRQTIQKAFAAIEEVERKNARAKQYRLLVKP